MAFPKALMMMMMIIIASLVYAAQVPQIDSNTVGRSLLQNNDIDCKSACDARCAETKRRNLCKRACGTCCERCHCVPPGTSGNEDVCPCYANMTTHGGRHKCP
ncbi:snakin-2-like isoform X2 [Coffea eugenioides]|uniref:snakin-2-like isoform X2 n=1 Tax=Coffea eugenioides TaxID=49369 RepID=UPI000F612B70|nr:snakin-2-like isoform X2 [Coffea eugenioides]XP_027149829.1 snakin-2-like isoform X2 [Coffea eugenioides]